MSSDQPIDMVLHCPKCGLQHIDAPDGLRVWGGKDENGMNHVSEEGPGAWDNPPHRSHMCHGCGHIWRPADVPTNGVQAVKTKGKADSQIASPAPAQPGQEGEREVDLSDDLAELSMLNQLIDLGSKAAGFHATSNSDDGAKGTAAYVQWQETRAQMGEMIRAHYADRAARAAPQPATADAVAQAIEALRPISHNSTDDPRGQADKAIALLLTAQREVKP